MLAEPISLGPCIGRAFVKFKDLVDETNKTNNDSISSENQPEKDGRYVYKEMQEWLQNYGKEIAEKQVGTQVCMHLVVCAMVVSLALSFLCTLIHVL